LDSLSFDELTGFKLAVTKSDTITLEEYSHAIEELVFIIISTIFGKDTVLPKESPVVGKDEVVSETSSVVGKDTEVQIESNFTGRTET